ncbi:hypothetical protein LIER_25916 [Lithospermum erythrorhizon]|uniref:Uncharacterized protein n=1 Tax=Lithospermum erythrorhizon TaxID=34254 RepID=A0AAV3R9L6_LITER
MMMLVEEFHDKIHAMEEVIGQATNPIVEERVFDFSCSEVTDVADVSKPSRIPTVDDGEGKTAEPSHIFEKVDNIAANVDPEGGNMDVSCDEGVMTEEVEILSSENLVESVDPSVKDTMDGLKESAPIGGDVVKPTVIDTDNDPVIIKGMNVDIPSATGNEHVTTGSTGVGVIPSVADTSAETADLPEERSMPIVGKKRLKNKYLRNMYHLLHNQLSLNIYWFPEHEPMREDDAQKSDDEDVVVGKNKRSKTKGKMEINENRTRVGNKRVTKNVVAVSTTNVALNSKEEEAK